MYEYLYMYVYIYRNKNMNNILSNYNRRLRTELIVKDRSPDIVSCNCRSKEECPLGGRCNSRNVYQACISPMEPPKKKHRESLYRDLRWKLEAKMI